jgi:hypothetical protein
MLPGEVDDSAPCAAEPMKSRRTAHVDVDAKIGFHGGRLTDEKIPSGIHSANHAGNHQSTGAVRITGAITKGR